MSIGFWQIAIVVMLVVLLFGRGKISSLMGDVAKGIKSFKKGMAPDVNEPSEVVNEPSEVNEENPPKNISENQDIDKKE
jgi:sec-independent protein translocase protein TatA